jgi:hypothetical protein
VGKTKKIENWTPIYACNSKINKIFVFSSRKRRILYLNLSVIIITSLDTELDGQTDILKDIYICILQGHIESKFKAEVAVTRRLVRPTALLKGCHTLGMTGWHYTGIQKHSELNQSWRCFVRNRIHMKGDNEPLM